MKKRNSIRSSTAIDVHLVSALGLAMLLATTSVLAGSPGSDLNGDDLIDDTDVAAMRAAFFTDDARADLDGDGHVNFADLGLLKTALEGGTPAPQSDSVAPPAVMLLPSTGNVSPGQVSVQLWWDFTGEATFGGGTDILYDPAALSLVSVVFADNPLFQPSFTRCDEPSDGCYLSGLIDGLATGNSLWGIAGNHAIMIATVTFTTLSEGATSISLAEDHGIAGPFLSRETLRTYPDLQFVGATLNVNATQIDVQPAYASFSRAVVGTSTVQDVVVRNAGTTSLVIGQIGDTDPLAPPFFVSADGCSAHTLPPSASCTVTFGIDPVATGFFEDTIALPSSDPENPVLTLNVFGDSAGPEIDVQAIIDLGQVRIGQSETRTLRIANNGELDLVLGQIGSTVPLEPPFAILSDPCSFAAIGSGDLCNVQLAFSPLGIGAIRGSFDIPSNDVNSPDTLVETYGLGVDHVGLKVGGVRTDKGQCRNVVTGRSFAVALNGVQKLDCEVAGLDADPSEQVIVAITGIALSGALMGGAQAGMDSLKVTCVNVTAGAQVEYFPSGARWNCVQHGLAVSPGDSVTIVVSGAAL